MQWLAWRGRYPDAAETLLRWVYSYRDGAARGTLSPKPGGKLPGKTAGRLSLI
jgi:hypothetical protein